MYKVKIEPISCPEQNLTTILSKTLTGQEFYQWHQCWLLKICNFTLRANEQHVLEYIGICLALRKIFIHMENFIRSTGKSHRMGYFVKPDWVRNWDENMNLGGANYFDQFVSFYTQLFHQPTWIGCLQPPHRQLGLYTAEMVHMQAPISRKFLN